MHQGQQSSLPNCEAVQRGAKLLRLDCAAGGERGGRGGTEVLYQEGSRDKERDTSGMTEGGGAGAESRTEGRRCRAKLAPAWCQHISSFCLFSPLFNELCQSQSIAQMKLWATSLEEI